MSEMENSFARSLYRELFEDPKCPEPELWWMRVSCAVNKICKENNLTITSKPLPPEAIAASINPASPSKKFVWSLSYKLNSRHQTVVFKSENQLNAFLSGLGSNPEVNSVLIENFYV